MVSDATRATSSVGGLLNSIASQTSQLSKTPTTSIGENTVGSTAIAPDSVTSDHIASEGITSESISRGAIGGDQLGIVNHIESDLDLQIQLGDGGYLQVLGSQYPPPTPGNFSNLAIDSNGNVVLSSLSTPSGPTGSVPNATNAVAGIVRLATLAEATAGTDQTTAVTPAGVGAVAATKVNLNQAFVGIDSDGVPYFDPGLDFTNAVPLYPDDDGVPYLPVGVPWTPNTGGGGGTSGTVSWNNITNLPATFAPSPHTHVAADITGGPVNKILGSDGTKGIWIDPPASTAGTTVSPATTAASGIVELATNAEVIDGTDAARAVTPAGYKAATDARFGAYKPDWNAITNKPRFTFDPAPDNQQVYSRLFTINGTGASAGAYVTFLISGMGDFGSMNKGTVLVHFAQRNTNGVAVQAYGFNTKNISGADFYTRPVGTNGLTFELWVRTASWTYGHGVTILSQSTTDPNWVTVNGADSQTTTAPTGLSAAYTVTDLANPTPPTAVELQAGGRLGPSITNQNGHDWNADTSGGWTAGYNSLNGPLGDTAGYLTQTIATDVNNLVQIAHRTSSDRQTSFKRERIGGTWKSWKSLGGEVLNVMDFGAKGDAKFVLDAAVSGSTVTSSTARFTSSDVGKTALCGHTVTTITAVNSSTSVTLGAAPSTATFTNPNTGYTSTGAPFSRFYWGTDDGAAFQAALDAARGGGFVLIPGGHEYAINRMLRIGNNTHVEARGAYIRKYAIESGFVWNVLTSTVFPTNAKVTNGESYITFNGGVWDSMGQHSQYGHNSFTFAHSHDIIMTNMILKHNGGSHFIEFDGVSNGKVLYCDFQGYRKIPLDTGTGDREYAECIQIDYGETNPVNAAQYAIDSDPCRNITAAFCSMNSSYEFSEMGYPGKLIGSHSFRDQGTPHETIHVYNNHIYGALDIGIRAYRWNDVIISNNQIDNTGNDSIRIDTYKYPVTNGYNRALDAGQIVVSNNIIRSSLADGIHVYGESYTYSDHGESTAEENTISELQITNNIIRKPAGYGIYIERTYNPVVNGNNITSSGQSGFYSYMMHYGLITSNKFVTVGNMGMEIRNTNQSIISGNHINTPQYCGIMLWDTSTDNSIQNNFIRGANSGVTPTTANPSDAKNYSSIYVSGSSSNCSVMSNTIRPGTSGWVAPTTTWASIHATSSCSNIMHFANDCNGLGGVTISGTGTDVPDATTPNRGA